MRNPLSVIAKLAVCATLMCAVSAQAADEKKADPVGTWSWTQPPRGGGEGPARTNTLTFKMEAGKLVGTLQAPGRGGGAATETKIDDAKVTGDEIKFSVTRELQSGQKLITKYTGKITAESIKGKVIVNRDGEDQPERDWEAKRMPEKKT